MWECDCSVVCVEQIGFEAWSEENKLQTVKAEHFVIHAMLRVNQLAALSRRRAAIRHGWCDFVYQHSHLESSLGCVHTKTSKHASPHNSGACTIERRRSRILWANRDPHKGRKCKHEFLVGREGWAWVTSAVILSIRTEGSFPRLSNGEECIHVFSGMEGGVLYHP